MLNSRHVTDADLLAPLVANHGRRVTFDRAIDVHTLPGAKPGHVVILE